MQEQKWEYKTKRIILQVVAGRPFDEPENDYMNKQAAEGWELVGQPIHLTERQRLFYWKRPVSEQV